MEEFEAPTPIDCLCHTPSVLAAGGYLFDEGVRSGKIHLYSLESMKMLEEFETSGTLDIKIRGQILYSANSGDVSAVHLNGLSSVKINTVDINTYIELVGDKVFVSDVRGRISVYGTEMVLLKTVEVAEAPIWVLKASDKELMYGSEDGSLSFMDIRTWSEHHKMKRASGVTSIYESDEYVYVGAYDECIEVVDKRMYKPVKKAKIGGGVWRICRAKEIFYLSCMYEGVKICDSELKVLKRFPTDSIAYGLTVTSDRVFFASFYDKKIYRLGLHGSGEPQM
ncbi:hypothetical protein [Encephalitozoon cuniculi GB-M1]|uniref:Uncharacterized protein n=1 Tax=Encephalitozoon cuniculi (strain GB-M1) TaxID=284813 RepID=Q8SV39_ENCCU|nr:uncharacterized protein ECU07_0280 [Encephalitozoon cuniculi GB-M1]CAD25560.1 hypothetical protein [Encephalitozoon cuniculi GB-M1]